MFVQELYEKRLRDAAEAEAEEVPQRPFSTR